MSRFPTTIWTTIRAAGSGRATAQEELVLRYRPAVVRFARGRGVEASEAEDIAQEVFLRLFDDRVLERADAARGRFRSLVLAITRHVLGHHFERRAAQRRGGGREPLSLEGAELDLEETLASEDRDADFDREWLATLIGRALERVQIENAAWYDSLHQFLVEERPQREIAQAQRTTESAVRNAIYRGRARLAAVIKEEISAYASSADEYDTEVRYLQTLLDGPSA